MGVVAWVKMEISLLALEAVGENWSDLEWQQADLTKPPLSVSETLRQKPDRTAVGQSLPTRKEI